MLFGIVKRWPVCALLVLGAAGSALAAPWRRSESLGSPLDVNVFRPDFHPASEGAEDLLVWDGRVVVHASRLDSDRMAQFGVELDGRLRAAFDGSWTVPFTSAEPLRVVVASGSAPGISRVFSLAGDRNPVVALNLGGRAPADAAEEAVRDVAVFVLRGLAPGAPDRLVSSAARALSLGGELSESDREELREQGAASEHALDDAGSELFAAGWIREMAASAGPGFVRTAWTSRVARGESSLSAFAAAFREAGGAPEDAFYRSLSRLYGGEEVL
ncbi:MAG TPA: hypothetical protein VG777_05455, partial [Thermoanaerobaculia bacterium]|nr:hypothetical protein [Thermoanaerobaculia bacterium]